MKRFYMLPLLCAIVSTASACSGSDGGTSDGGSSGTAVSDEALCSDACNHIVACAGPYYGVTMTAPPCVEQCGRELAGTGYLDPEVARIAFSSKRSLGTDPSCAGDLQLIKEFVDHDYEQLSRKAVIDECAAAYSTSSCTTLPSNIQRLRCFRYFVQFSEKYRKGMEACGMPAQPCEAWDTCIDDSRPPPETNNDEPWYGKDFGGTM